MDNNIYENYDDDVFICNAKECFNANEYSISHLREKNLRPNHNTQCSLCAYDFDNLEELREQIFKEMQINKESKRNIIKAKILETLIAFGLGLMVFCTVAYFIIRAYMLPK